MDEGFGLNRFDGGTPGGGPGGSIDARGRFFGTCPLGIVRGTNFFGMRNWGFGFGLMRFELAASFALSFLFACFFFVLIAFFLWLRLVHFAKIFIVLLKLLLKASQAHSQARLVDFVIDCFVQDRKI